MAQENGSPKELTSVQKAVASARSRKTKASIADIKKLFVSYDKANEAVIAAQKALEAAMAQRSELVRGIVETSGETQFKRADGSVLKVMTRGGKDKDGRPNGSPESWFFRGEGISNALEV
jgi:hypothetical protein